MNPWQAYIFCPRCGNKLEEKTDSMRCVSCGYDLYLNPIPCNGVIIENENKEILLVKRKFEPQKGFWDVPGGFINSGEELEHSVKREILEEISVEVEMTGIVGIYKDSYVFQGIKFPTLGIMVSAKIISGTLKAADDAEEFKYFTKQQVSELSIAFDAVKRALDDYFKHNFS